MSRRRSGGTRAIGLPGVYMKAWRSPSVPTRGRTRKSHSRDGANGVVGMRARQRAAATGKPADHRNRKEAAS